MRFSPRKVSKVFGIVVGISFLFVISLFVWTRSAIDHRWAQTEGAVRGLQVEMLVRETVRPVLHGTAVLGNAWDEYPAAIQSINFRKDTNDAWKNMESYAKRDPSADIAQAESHVQANLCSLDALRQGASRACSRCPYEWEMGMYERRLNPSYEWLVDLAIARARMLEQEGNFRKAVELVLDACQFSRDSGYDATTGSLTMSMEWMRKLSDELRRLITSRGLSHGDLETIDLALDILDRTFPKYSHMIMNEALCWGLSYLSDSAFERLMEGDPAGRYSPGWRVAFSYRIAKAQAFDAILSECRKQVGVDETPWTSVRNQSMQVPDWRPHLQITWRALNHISTHFQWERSIRFSKAQLRLLRIGAHWRATGQVLDLDDPFGLKMKSEETPSRLKAWSVGCYQEDDVNTGEWSTWGHSIVLEVEQ